MERTTPTKSGTRSLRPARRNVVVTAVFAILIGVPSAVAQPMLPNSPTSAGRDALWEIVHDRCYFGYQRTGAYAPCALVDEESGTALYKVDFDPYQFLLIPLGLITGIEDPILQQATSRNYLYDAWAARALVTSRLNNSLPESDIVLAINPKNARSQDQLHIHISCVSPTTSTVLKDVNASEYAHWKPLPTDLSGHTYQALAISRNALESKNLFQDVYAKVTSDSKKMDHAAVAVANIAPDRFLLLVAEGTESQPVAAENLQDHDCSIAETR